MLNRLENSNQVGFKAQIEFRTGKPEIAQHLNKTFTDNGFYTVLGPVPGAPQVRQLKAFHGMDAELLKTYKLETYSKEKAPQITETYKKLYSELAQSKPDKIINLDSIA